MPLLGDIAEVRRGFTTGANDFFYLESTGKPAPKGLVHVRNSAGWEGFIEYEFLKHVIKSPRECKSIVINLKDLKYKLFICHLSKDDLKKQGKTYALEYIKWGELQGYNGRPTCFWVNSISLCEAILYDIHVHNKQEVNFFGAVLNASYIPILIELTGRANLGEGVLDFKVYETADLFVLQPSMLTSSKHEQLLSAFRKMATREIKNIFEELGLTQPNRNYSNIKSEGQFMNCPYSPKFFQTAGNLTKLSLKHSA